MPETKWEIEYFTLVLLVEAQKEHVFRVHSMKYEVLLLFLLVHTQ